LGWYVVIWISVASAVYVGGGVAYGRHKNPPTSGAKSLSISHPNGEPFMNWHPHRWHWGELVELCYDGLGFTMAHWRRIRGDADASYDPIMARKGEGEGVDKDGDEESGMVKPSKQRRRSEPLQPGRDSPDEKQKKKKKKSKPRPSRRSLPTQLDDETKQWLTSTDPSGGALE
jgi:hypothetical protein